jgi:hypothetical protein
MAAKHRRPRHQQDEQPDWVTFETRFITLTDVEKKEAMSLLDRWIARLFRRDLPGDYIAPRKEEKKKESVKRR